MDYLNPKTSWNKIKNSDMDDSGAQLTNCVYFLTTWMLWSVNRQLIQTAIIFIRWVHIRTSNEGPNEIS